MCRGAARGTAPADRLCDPVDRPVSALAGRRQYRHRAAASLDWPRARVRDRVTELLELLRLDPESYRTQIPAPAVGRRAAARRRRPRARRRPRSAADGRALRGGRPDHPRRSARRDCPHPSGDQEDGRFRHPRHRGGAAPGDGHRDPRQGPARAMGHAARPPRTSGERFVARASSAAQGERLEAPVVAQGRRPAASGRGAPKASRCRATHRCATRSPRWRRAIPTVCRSSTSSAGRPG